MARSRFKLTGARANRVTHRRSQEKIREGFEGAGLPMPIVENFCGGVRVTFQRKNVVRTDENAVVKNVVKSEEKTVEKVWGLIKEDPYITTKQIADAIGLSTRGIEENIKKLKKQGRLRRIGGDNGGHWEVIESKA